MRMFILGVAKGIVKHLLEIQNYTYTHPMTILFQTMNHYQNRALMYMNNLYHRNQWQCIDDDAAHHPNQ